MESNDHTPKNYTLKFNGEGAELFGIMIINWLLTAVTLGLYYPWAKAKELKYTYGTTSLDNDPFAFHGTGKEMFIGFIKAVGILILIYGVFIALFFMGQEVIGTLFLYAAISALIPFAIHGSYRYRMSRTTWRGIRFGYRGDLNEFLKLFYKWAFITIVTLGIGGAWMAMNLRNYILGHVRFGNLKFNYKGDGGEFFILNLKGYFLTIFTLGIYGFWWQKDLLNYYIDNLSLHHEDGREIKFESAVTGSGFFGLMIVNVLIVIFTFGLGSPWAIVRTLKYVMDNTMMTGNINFDQLLQTEEEYTDATGEDVGDMLDLGMGI